MTATESNVDKKLTANAHLALQLESSRDHATSGLAPNDEELTALYENKLDSTRRAQILSHIANNTKVYTRWLRCVETQAFLDEDHQVASKPSIVHRCLSFLDRKVIMGAGLSTIAVSLLIVLLIPREPFFDVQLSIDSANNNWGILLQQEWQALPAAKKPSPVYSSNRSFFSKPKTKTETISEAQQIIALGFKKTMNTIGAEAFKDYGITVTQLTINITESRPSAVINADHDLALQQLGQLSALTALQCKLDAKNERLTPLLKALLVLQKQLTSLNDKPVQKIMTTLNASKTSLCAVTHDIVLLMQQ